MASSIRDLVQSTYDAIRPVKAFNAVPRFGHTSNITDIYSTDGIDTSVMSDYIQGTVFIAGFCLTAFTIWVLSLLILKCFGKRAGILAGHPFMEDRNIHFSRSKKNTAFRMFLVFSCFTVSCSGVVFLIKGAHSVSDVFEDVRDGAAGLEEVTKLIVSTTDELIAFGDGTTALRAEIVELIDEGVCSAAGGAGVGAVEVQQTFDDAAVQVVDILTELEGFSKNKLTELRDTFAVEFDTVNDGLSASADSGESYARPMFISIPVVVFGLLLMMGAILAWQELNISMYFKIQTWCILPLFGLLVVVIGFVLAAIGTVLVANSDICLGGESKTPEGTVDIILGKQGLNGLAMEAVDYYIIDGCNGEFSKKLEIEALVSDLQGGLNGIIDLKVILENDQQTLEAACGVGPGALDFTKTTLEASIAKFDEFVKIADKTIGVLECTRINGIFVDLFHGAMCTSAPSAFMWMFATMMAVYGLGMTIVLFRGALLPSIDTSLDYDHEQDNRDDVSYIYDDEKPEQHISQTGVTQNKSGLSPRHRSFRDDNHTQVTSNSQNESNQDDISYIADNEEEARKNTTQARLY